MSISEQVKELRKLANSKEFEPHEPVTYGFYARIKSKLFKAADTIESPSANLADMERPVEDCGGGWIPCSEPPKHNREVLIFNGESYSVGYYDGKTWVNAIHPVEWQEIRHEP